MIGLLSLVVLVHGPCRISASAREHQQSADGSGRGRAARGRRLRRSGGRAALANRHDGHQRTAVVDATLLAIDEMNEQGGLLGRKIEAIVRDGARTRHLRRRGEEADRRRGVGTVFGCWTSACRKTVLPIFETQRQSAGVSGGVRGIGEIANIIYIGAAPNQQIIPAVKWCLRFWIGGDSS